MLASVSDHFRTIAGLFHCFFRLQEMVSGITDWNYSEACASCIQMLSLYKALQDEALSLGRDCSWQLMLKCHLLQELIEYGSAVIGLPSEFWCYRDESWCDFWARASSRRGGTNSPGTTTLNFLNRFRAMDDMKD